MRVSSLERLFCGKSVSLGIKEASDSELLQNGEIKSLVR
jgi:hypothetical protein